MASESRTTQARVPAGITRALPAWFNQAFPFLVPLALNLREMFPEALGPLVPYLDVGGPVALLVLVVPAATPRRRPGRRDGGGRATDMGRDDGVGEEDGRSRR